MHLKYTSNHIKDISRCCVKIASIGLFCLLYHPLLCAFSNQDGSRCIARESLPSQPPPFALHRHHPKARGNVEATRISSRAGNCSNFRTFLLILTLSNQSGGSREDPLPLWWPRVRLILRQKRGRAMADPSELAIKAVLQRTVPPLWLARLPIARTSFTWPLNQQDTGGVSFLRRLFVRGRVVFFLHAGAQSNPRARPSQKCEAAYAERKERFDTRLSLAETMSGSRRRSSLAPRRSQGARFYPSLTLADLATFVPMGAAAPFAARRRSAIARRSC